MSSIGGITEEQFFRQVLNLARLFGWRCVHFRPAMTAHGWRTPVAGDGQGFPDTILVKPGRHVIYAELKVKAKLSPEQEEWGKVLSETPDVHYFVWRPDDLDEITAILRG